jgi:2-methylisocitrate lyase-like PEP mutase family enzyme
MVARTVAAYHRSGVAALHLEDQIQTKVSLDSSSTGRIIDHKWQRCGHLGGKELVSLETFRQRIAAAAQARERLGSDIVIIARTDALKTVSGDDFEEAVRRLKAAVVAGADVAFLEGSICSQCPRFPELTYARC